MTDASETDAPFTLEIEERPDEYDETACKYAAVIQGVIRLAEAIENTDPDDLDDETDVETVDRWAEVLVPAIETAWNVHERGAYDTLLEGGLDDVDDDLRDDLESTVAPLGKAFGIDLETSDSEQPDPVPRDRINGIEWGAS